MKVSECSRLWQGAAVEDGRLKCGDRLLSVNGVDLTGKTQKDAVDEFRKVPAGGKVKLVVSRQEEVQSKSEVCANLVVGWTAEVVVLTKFFDSFTECRRSRGAEWKFSFNSIIGEANSTTSRKL